jgi:hypothetical protein
MDKIHLKYNCEDTHSFFLDLLNNSSINHPGVLGGMNSPRTKSYVFIGSVRMSYLI